MPVQDSGAAMFARYAYPPNELGYCGPNESGHLLDAAGHTSGSQPRPDVSWAARQFDGAWCYLRTLAAGTGHDPLDYRVVEAYWLGSPLLERLDGRVFARAVTESFSSQHGARLAGLSAHGGSVGPARAHHGYHVFEVYPWTGLLGVGDGQPALSILDQCRIRWGRVQSVEGDHALVRSRPLARDGRRLHLGRPRTERPRWASGGRSLLPGVREGDWVAMHWDWICDTLSARQLTQLRRRTAQQLELTNNDREAIRETA